MNSLFQTLYQTPQFREFIFSLPLEYGPDDEVPEDYEAKHKPLKINTTKYKILRAFQNLFVQMQSSDFKATSTKDVTDSFGWMPEIDEDGKEKSSKVREQ